MVGLDQIILETTFTCMNAVSELYPKKVAQPSYKKLLMRRKKVQPFVIIFRAMFCQKGLVILLVTLYVFTEKGLHVC